MKNYKAINIIIHMIPSVLLLAAFILMILPWKISEIAPVKPNIPLIVLFFWTYIKVDSIHLAFIFLCALMFDVIMPVPMGYHCILFLFISAVMLWRSTHFIGSTLANFYGEFAIATTLFYVLATILSQFVSDSANLGVNVIISWLMTLFAFWLVLPLLNLCNRFYRESFDNG